MDDVFARIGLAIQHLVENSTIHGPAKEEALRLAAELQNTEISLGGMVNERVTAAAEALEGRNVSFLDAKIEALKLEFVPVEAAEQPGAEPGDPEVAGKASLSSPEGPTLAGGDAGDTVAGPALDEDVTINGGGASDVLEVETVNPDTMTIAEATAWLDAHGVDHAGVTLRDDLRGLVKLAIDEAAEAAATPPAGEPE